MAKICRMVNGQMVCSDSGTTPSQNEGGTCRIENGKVVCSSDDSGNNQNTLLYQQQNQMQNQPQNKTLSGSDTEDYQLAQCNPAENLSSIPTWMIIAGVVGVAAIIGFGYMAFSKK